MVTQSLLACLVCMHTQNHQFSPVTKKSKTHQIHTQIVCTVSFTDWEETKKW